MSVPILAPRRNIDGSNRMPGRGVPGATTSTATPPAGAGIASHGARENTTRESRLNSRGCQFAGDAFFFA
jgi:hypothetical protein